MTEREHYLAGLQNREEAEGLLSRWSRRKRAVAEQEAVKQAPQAVRSAPLEGKPDPKPVELPSIESLTSESDFSAFLSPEVDEVLRKAALRKLFHMADFNITDGLNDYDDDFTHFEPLGKVVPYHLKRMLAREAEEKKQELEESIDIASACDLEQEPGAGVPPGEETAAS